MDEILQINEKEAIDIVGRYANDLSAEQLQALPLLAYGMTYRKVADYIKQPHNVVLTWIRTNQVFRAAITELRNNHATYHKEMLNQTATLAWERIYSYLAEEFPSDDKDNRAIQAKLAQFIIGELGLKEIKIKDTTEDKPLKVTENSADLIAKRVIALQNPDSIVGQYRITAPTANEDTRYNSVPTALLVDKKDGVTSDEVTEAKEYEYAHHKDTKYGELTIRGNRFICHVCGAKTKDLVVHLRTEHNLTTARYRNMFGIPLDVPFIIPEKDEETDEVLLAE